MIKHTNKFEADEIAQYIKSHYSDHKTEIEFRCCHVQSNTTESYRDKLQSSLCLT
jgi:hypothetical protein